MRSVRYSPQARRALQKHRKEAERIIAKMSAYAADSRSQANNVKRLKGRPAILRLRLGDYRVLFVEDKDGILVLDAGPRGSIYDEEGEQMNKAVHTKTPGGEDVVILPAADYARLVSLAEDAHDLALAEKALATVKSERDEVLTEAEMLELLAAPSPVSFWRRRRNLTQAALAARVGITQAYLAQIERGKRTGNLRLYRRLAETLHLDIGDILPSDDANESSGRRKPAKAGRR